MNEKQAIENQHELSQKVIKKDQFGDVEYLAGVDVAYEKDGDMVIAAITILDANTLELLETVTHVEKVFFPYIPGLFSFRELPPVLKAYQKLQITPDLIICDGQGYAHPRRFGLACHLGIELNVPTIGCAKTRLIGEYSIPELKRGSFSNLIDNDEIVGRVLRTQDGIKPVFVSIGHLISIETASDWVIKASPEYRLPETTRSSDHAVKIAMKELKSNL